ncbi:MAG: GGDEF domain-containing protein [Arcobacter sp.]|nr:MAG: GGDEF domain-containing protein [Arcobacter sp.]
MKDKMLNLIKLAVEDRGLLSKIDDIYTLYEQLQYNEDINEMAETLLEWLALKYQVQNMDFSLYDLEEDKKTNILKKGEPFFLDEEFSFYFIINTHTDVNAVVSFQAQNEEIYNIVHKERDFLDIAFFQISPILQCGIIKKHHIESSSIDSVTNVYNRKYLIKHIHKMISFSHDKEKNISFLMIGIDRFKAVIEEFDYDIGDKVLIELAKVIHKNIKDFDIVARLTGDEFLVALINLKSNDEAKKIAKNIIDEFSKTDIIVDEVNKQVLRKTICIGISSFPQDSEDINQVLKNADSFLEEAKKEGRSKFAVYTKEKESTIDLF